MLKKIFIGSIATIIVASAIFSVSKFYKNENEVAASRLPISNETKILNKTQFSKVLNYYDMRNVLSTKGDTSIDEANNLLGPKDTNTTYRVITDYIPMNDEYQPSVNFYCETLEKNDGSMQIVKVIHSSLDRNYKDITMQFDGELFFMLEDNSKLYYIINGDFFEKGRTEFSIESIENYNSKKITYNIIDSGNFYNYVYRSPYIDLSK